jgi:hypothetical protein
MTHAGRCFSLFFAATQALAWLTIYDGKIVSMDKLKINRLCGIFKDVPEFVVLADGESLAVLL